MRIFGSKAAQTIGIGTSKDLYLTDTELSRLTSHGGLQVGSSYSGSVNVAGILEASSDMVGTINLVATKSGQTAVFGVIPSVFNKGIIVQAIGGVIFF
jgi:hypothetical protein